jgi:hypothetical protein
MKKFIIFIFTVFFLSGCNSTTDKPTNTSTTDKPTNTSTMNKPSDTEPKFVNLTFSDIKSIDIYKFNIPTNAEKKIVTAENDIKKIINDINSIKIVRNATYEDFLYGGGAMTFVFNKTDGTQFVIFYNGGTIKTPDGSPNQFWYKIDDYSMFSKWDSLNYSAQKVSQSELPIINKN